MPLNVVIGSGPAAAAVALALLQMDGEAVSLLDLGASLEPERQELLKTVADSHPTEWDADVRAALVSLPVSEARGELPQKRVLGSDFPFRDLGQLENVDVPAGGNRRIVSGAFGGFSNAWGAQVLPFTRQTISEWPIAYDELLPHYKAILREIPFAATDDDYSELFPLLAPSSPLPPLSDNACAALDRYASRRQLVRRAGIFMGQARLAMSAPQCIECGLCLTGCPLGLIYSARHTLDPLINSGKVRYQPGLLALEVGEDDAGPWVRARRIDDGAIVTERADRIFVAAGALGSTRIVLNSIRRRVSHVEFAESAQFVLPFVSARAHRDPRTYPTFTLNQFSMAVCYGREGIDLAQLHLYPYNPAFDDELPALFAGVARLKASLLSRTVAALGYIPSWASPAMVADVDGYSDDTLPIVRLSGRPNPRTRLALTRTIARLAVAAPLLDLWPCVPVLRLSGPGKSYHFGGSLPHVSGRPRAGGLETDTLGRIAEWRHIHMADGAVLPTIPATTFTLSVMANAHRIATSAARA